MRRLRSLLLFVLVLPILLPAPVQSAPQQTSVLADVWKDAVTLADQQGNPLETTGPSFTFGQGARLFWSANGETLYIARDDALYAAGAGGGAAVQLPGYYSRTLALSQDGEHLYYLETVSPQERENDPDRVSFPLREVVVTLLEGGTGRLAGYFGRYAANTAKADLTFAAMLYAHDGGLLGPGRPHLWPTFGSNVLATCCFPDPGISLFDVGTGDTIDYDDTFIPGPAAVNNTRTYLAGPTTDGTLRIIDLITGGSRDYTIEIAGGLGTIERVAWSPDDTMLYFVSRYSPTNPIELNAQPAFTLDLRSANLTVYRLNLVTGVIRELATRDDVYGISSLAATDQFVFAVVVDSNAALINALNTGLVSPAVPATDPSLVPYFPQTHLWRINIGGGGSSDIADDVWGVVARP